MFEGVWGRGMKIIHVDTNRKALQIMQEELSRIVPEAELYSFDRPDPALAFAGAEGCDVLLTEIELWSEPFGGIRLAKAVRKLNPRVNIIFVTVCSENEVTCEMNDLRVSGFVTKPWTPEKLAAAFQDLRCPLTTHNHVDNAAACGTE